MAEAGSKETTKIYLIKSSDRILGPYSKDEVVQRLISKEISLFDEVARSQGRWRHLRVDTEFQEAVEKARDDIMNTRDDTEVQSPSFSGTDARANVRDVVGEVLSSSSRTSEESVRSYAPQATVRLKDLRSTDSKRYWYGAIVLAAILGGVYFYISNFGMSLNFVEGKKSYQDLVQKGIDAVRVGDGFFGLQHLVKADETRILSGFPPDSSALLTMAALKMIYDGETVVAKRLAEEVMQSSPQPQTAAMAKNILAIAAARNDELKESKSLLESADLSLPEIAFNLAAVESQLGNLEMAIAILRNLLKAKNEFVEAKYLLARSLAEMSGVGIAGRQEAYEIFKVLRAEHGPFSLEATIEMAALDLREGNKQGAAVLVKSAFEEDPKLFDDHVFSPFILNQSISPAIIVPDCKAIHKLLNNYVSQAMLAVCYARAGDPNQAQKELATLISTRSQDLLIRSINIYTLLELGRDEEARTSLNLIRNNMDFPIFGKIMLGRTCTEKGDLECERQAWEALLRESPIPTIAMLGEVRWLLKQGRRDEASELLKKVKARAPRLRQVFQLSDILEQK